MGDQHPPFYHINGGGGGGGARRAPGGPPPPPPPPGGGGGGQRGGPPPQPPMQRVNPNQGQPMQGQHMMMPHPQMPPPPREAIPMRFQARPIADISDIRRERMTDKEVREVLSEYLVVRFERIADEDSHDDRSKNKSSWQQCYRTFNHDLSKGDIVRQIRLLNKQTQPVTEKKRTLNPDQQRQIEKQLDEISLNDRDPRFHWELAQIDHQLKRVGEKLDRKYGHIRAKSRDSHSHRRSKSRDSHGRKKYYQRISLTAFYKRCPKVDAPVHMMLQEHEMMMRMPPPQQQQMLNQQQQQQQHQQQGHGQQRPPGVFPVKPGGGPLKGFPPKPQIVAMSDSDTGSSYSDDEMWSDDEVSHSTRTDSSHSHKRGRRGHKDKRYLEHHFGVKPHAPIRRHSRHEDNYTFETLSPRMIPLAPPPPRPRLLPSEDVVVQAFAAGKAEGRVEERIEARTAEEAAAAAYRPRNAPAPRIIQAAPARGSFRVVRASDVTGGHDLDDELEFERLCLDDRRYDDRRAEELRYPDEVDDWRDVPRRRRTTYGRFPRDEDAIIVEEDRDRYRHREAAEYIRRESSPSHSPFTNPNPFAPHLPRRNSMYTRGTTYYPLS